MKKKIIAIFGALMVCVSLVGCADKSSTQATEPQTEKGTEAAATDAATVETEEETFTETSEETSAESALPDGIYTAEFSTDSGMFRVSEACDGKGTLTVENGKMTIHISLGSKKIVNLYPGLAEDAAKDGAELLMPTVDTVTYSDGLTEEVYGYDVPVPVLDEEFDLALIGTKGVWYDHKVSVSNPEPVKDEAEAESDETEAETDEAALEAASAEATNLTDGTYSIEVTLEGGSGKATVLSPATITISGDDMVAKIEWSSSNYDYMLVNGEKYLPVNTEGNSVFEIPVAALDVELDVIGDTVAMSTPHEVEYKITFHSNTAQAAE